MKPVILTLIAIPFAIAFIVWAVRSVFRSMKYARKLKEENDLIYERTLMKLRDSDDYLFMQ